METIHKICGAKTRSGARCQRYPTQGRNRCKLHGGATPRGMASPHFKTGKYSKYLPDRLIRRYEEASSDKTLVSFREDLALLQCRITQLLDQLGTVEPGSEEENNLWKQVGEMLEKRIKVAQAERKRLVEMGQMMSVEEIRNLANSLAQIVRNNVKDPKQLAAISDQIRQLMGESENTCPMDN